MYFIIHKMFWSYSIVFELIPIVLCRKNTSSGIAPKKKAQVHELSSLKRVSMHNLDISAMYNAENHLIQ